MTSLRARLYDLLEPAEEGDLASRAIDLFLGLLIVADVVYFIVAEQDARGAAARTLEYGILAVFTVEYGLRAWTAVEEARYGGRLGRLRYLRTPLALVDLVAILPWLDLMGLDVPGQLTAVRMFRMLKLFRYSAAAQLLGRTIWRVRHELGVTTVAVFMAIVSSGLVMHGLEKESNPSGFGSIGRSIWWSVVTMTTVGYGDAVPMSTAGKVVAGVLMVFGIGMFAIPAGLLGASFTREVTVHVERRRAKSERRREQVAAEREERMLEAALEQHASCPHCGKSLAAKPDGG